MNSEEVNHRPELGGNRYKVCFVTSTDYQEVGKREGKRMCTLLTCD